MDSFIFLADYDKHIQADNLTQVIGNKTDVLNGVQMIAVEECKSYLRAKYDISNAFTSITQHNSTNTYNAGQTVYLNATAYNALSTYALGSNVLQNGNIYKCTTAITIPEAFSASHWTLINSQYAKYYAIAPHAAFDYYGVYFVGDEVTYKNKVYTCKVNSSMLTHSQQLQNENNPITKVFNVFPDDPTNGASYWGTGTAYVIPANTEITNTTYWAEGDSRNQKLLQICIDIVLYHVHRRISPQNIPAIRVIQYMGNPEDRETRGQRVLYPTYCALGWLQACAIGIDISPDLPVLQPTQGTHIIFGGNVKNKNSY